MDVLSKVIKLFFGSKADKDRKEIMPYVEKIKAVYPSSSALTNDELRARSAALSQSIADFIADDAQNGADIAFRILQLAQRTQQAADVDAFLFSFFGGFFRCFGFFQGGFFCLPGGDDVYKQLLPIVLAEGQDDQRDGGNEAGDRCQQLADTEIAPIEAVHAKAFNEGAAQAIPGQVAQHDLSIKLALFRQEMQQHKACGIPHGFIQEGGVVIGDLAGDLMGQTHPQKAIRFRAEGFPVEEIAPAADALADQKAQRCNIQHCAYLDLFHQGESVLLPALPPLPALLGAGPGRRTKKLPVRRAGQDMDPAGKGGHTGPLSGNAQ